MTYLKRALPDEHHSDLSSETVGRHAKIHIGSLGIVLLTPITPSDHRWFMNWRAHFRRSYRAATGSEALC